MPLDYDTEQRHEAIRLLIDIKYSLKWLCTIGNVMMWLALFFVLIMFPVFTFVKR